MDTFSFIVLMERGEIETCLQYFYCQKLLEKGFRVKYRLETRKRLEKVIKGMEVRSCEMSTKEEDRGGQPMDSNLMIIWVKKG